ncbi:hypothetical protein [Neisseria zalophi]|uniref:Lipoprotein n=1 Tax=Neisseria zalophi TaxID=640030 RepID=A0A5J6PUJ8_9NEIS|nr:hypothetical protein [Neisseria zalophi]QEY26195.1 hypothetical protein D0T92_06440 [Neisseria zalophi]
MKNLLFFIIISLILSSCLYNKESTLIKSTNLLDETGLEESIGDNFNEIFNLLSDDGIKSASIHAKVIEVNGYKILYSKPNDIFILKDKDVVARINNDSRIFYNSSAAPLVGEQVLLRKNIIVYNNNNNSFIDYGIDGLDIIEENQFKFLRESQDNQSKKLPNSSFVNGNKCLNPIEGLAGVACCGQSGYAFTLEKGWTVNEKLTQKCQSIN